MLTERTQMDAKTLEALKASIAKWERNAEATDPFEFKISEKDCPLCAMFKIGSDECKGCPVFEKTGATFCRETPYIPAATARRDWRCGDVPADRAHAAARDEVAFLRSLLLEETP
jgi:hypothetical protein